MFPVTTRLLARVRRSFCEFARSNSDTRLLPIDDCSVDDTQNVLGAMQSEVGSQIGVLSLPQNMGKAEAALEAVEVALADCVLPYPW